MTIGTQPFVQGSSIMQPIDAYPFPPSLRHITTVVRLEYAVGESGAPVARLSGSDSEEVIGTTAGKAFIRFLEATSKQPGHDWTRWSAPMDDMNCLLVFIGWKEGTIPPAPFSSTESFNLLTPSSELSVFSSFLRSPAEISHIPLAHFGGASTKDAGISSFEMVTWKIPAHLDPTYHDGPATTFNKLGWALDMMVVHPVHKPPHEMLRYRRAWVADIHSMEPSTTEPNEKTHVFMFTWKS